MSFSEKTDLAHIPPTNKPLGLTVIMAGMLMGCVSSPPTLLHDQKPTAKTTEQTHQLSLSGSISRIQGLLGKRLGTDSLLSSLDAIEAFIRGQLVKDGYRASVSVHMAPFTPLENKGLQYLIASISTPEDTEIISIASPDEEKIEKTLTPIFDTFRDTLHKMVLQKFIEIAAKNNGIFTAEKGTKDIGALLEKHAHQFIKHGFDYKGCSMGRNRATGEIEILIDMGNIHDKEIIQMHFGTGLFDHEEPRKPQDRQEEALLLFASN